MTPTPGRARSSSSRRSSGGRERGIRGGIEVGLRRHQPASAIEDVIDAVQGRGDGPCTLASLTITSAASNPAGALPGTGERVKTRTGAPHARRCLTRWVPMKPAPITSGRCGAADNADRYPD